MKQLHYLILIFVLTYSSNGLEAQIGGSSIFEFLELPISARISGLAGSAIAVLDDDLSIGLSNPALFNKQMHQQFSFNHSFHLADIDHGYAGYGYHHEPWDISFSGGIQYIAYGDFVLADEFGNKLGSFKANEFGINLGAATQVYDRVRVGANVKLISSQLEGYESLGLALDIGAHFIDTSGLFTAALVIKISELSFLPTARTTGRTFLLT